MCLNKYIIIYMYILKIQMKNKYKKDPDLIYHRIAK